MSKKDSTKNTKFADINEVLKVLDKATKWLENLSKTLDKQDEENPEEDSDPGNDKKQKEHILLFFLIIN